MIMNQKGAVMIEFHENKDNSYIVICPVCKARFKLVEEKNIIDNDIQESILKKAKINNDIPFLDSNNWSSKFTVTDQPKCFLNKRGQKLLLDSADEEIAVNVSYDFLSAVEIVFRTSKVAIHEKIFSVTGNNNLYHITVNQNTDSEVRIPFLKGNSKKIIKIWEHDIIHGLSDDVRELCNDNIILIKQIGIGSEELKQFVYEHTSSSIIFFEGERNIIEKMFREEVAADEILKKKILLKYSVAFLNNGLQEDLDMDFLVKTIDRKIWSPQKLKKYILINNRDFFENESKEDISKQKDTDGLEPKKRRSHKPLLDLFRIIREKFI